MRTNSKHVRALVRAHILESVTDKNGDNFPTNEQALAHLKEEFERVSNHPHTLKRLPNHQERFSDYLWDLPFGFEFAENDISAFLETLDINPNAKKFSSDASANLYHYLIFREINS
jgi:hypothetical protein